MARTSYAEETERIAEGTGTFRTFGPPSPASRRASHGMRRTVYRFISGWRPTRRGIRLGRLTFEAVVSPPALRGTALEADTLGGVPVQWTTAPAAQGTPPRTRVVLYLHGGGYVVGSPRTHRSLTSRISHVLETPVASVDYRMAPEVSIRDSFADVIAAYRGLLDAGYPAEGIVVAGDSAGGGLAAGVGLAAVDQGLPLPAALVLLSPWLDLENTGGSHESNFDAESFIGGDVLHRISRALLPNEADRRDWRVSPYHASDELLRQLPPTLIQVGTAEVLLDDSVGFSGRMAAAGGTVELQRFVDQGHVVAMWTGIPEARRALSEISSWVRAALPSGLEPSAPTSEQLSEAADHPAPGPGPEDLPA